MEIETRIPGFQRVSIALCVGRCKNTAQRANETFQYK